MGTEATESNSRRRGQQAGTQRRPVGAVTHHSTSVYLGDSTTARVREIQERLGWSFSRTLDDLLVLVWSVCGLSDDALIEAMQKRAANTDRETDEHG